jgi:CHAD domain-containing protein
MSWSDPEGVHDMRVSSRRLRGALRDFMPYLRKRGLTKSLKQIKSVADALGEVRDQDVAIMGLEKLSANAPESANATLNQFIHARATIRKKARKDLQQALRSRALKQMQSDFAQAIDSATTKSGRRKRQAKGDNNSAVIYVDVARAIVLERLKEMEKLSDGFYHPLKVKPLHNMRIAAKRLRYALELFEQCLGPGTVVFARKVAGLQTSLGELHDCDIWIENFGEQLEIARREASRDRTAGSLWLLAHFVRLHAKHLRNALARWQEWETNGFSEQLRELLKPDMKASTPIEATSTDNSFKAPPA